MVAAKYSATPIGTFSIPRWPRTRFRPLPRGSYESAGERLAAFVREHDIKVLNVAGSRGSKEPGVAVFVKRALDEAFFLRVEVMVLRG